ncbi:MAG: hypothetical protein M1825_002019 [Sarcosagium campestre]|nr:MAG: hypothetical protein M1825_002019 [Sarcosagium campestre]
MVDDDQYYLISACKDNNPMLRDGITGDWIGTFLGHKGAVWQVRISSDATLAASASADFTAIVWDTTTGEALHTLQHNHIVKSVAFPSQPRPAILATGGFEKKLRIFDLSRSTTNATPANSTNGALNGIQSPPQSPPPSFEVGPGVHGGSIKSIVWGAEPNVIVTAAEDRKIRWWDLRSRSVVAEFEVDGVIGSCELNSLVGADNTAGGAGQGSNGIVGGNSVLSVAAGKTVYFFDGLAPRQLLKSTKTPYENASVALHAGTRRFITGASGGETWVRIYDYDEGTELDVAKGHHGPIWSLSFSPDGKMYASGSEDGTVKLWKYTQDAYGLWR